MVTFEQARAIIEASLRPHWPTGYGTLTTLPTGRQDATHWRVTAGAREYLIDGDDDYDLFDAPAYLVSKEDGSITRLVVIANLDRLDSMRPAP